MILEYADFTRLKADIDSVVFFGEKFLEHEGLLRLESFINAHRSTLIFVSATHKKCAALFARLKFVEYTVLLADNLQEDAFQRMHAYDLLVGCSKNEFAGVTGRVQSAVGSISYYTQASSSFVNIIPEEMKRFVVELFSKYSYSDIAAKLDSFRDLNILVIGETIIDEYIFTTAMNKSNKEPIIASQYKYKEKYAGGVLAVANHLANFSDNVKLISRLGELDSHKAFIEKHLNPRVNSTFLVRENSPTVRKQRIVEEHLARKMFEVYYFNNKPVSEKNNQEFEEELRRQLPSADLVILTDYGHGLFTSQAIAIIEENAKFLAVNTQTNAGNKGFNLISKYQKADFIAIDCPEAQLECRNKEVPISELIYQIAANTNCERVTVTMGKLGNLYLYKGDLYQVPMLSVKAIDTTGAGDTFFAIASCAAANGFEPDITGFLGNIAGAEACMIIGNKKSISKQNMLEHIKNFSAIAGVEHE